MVEWTWLRTVVHSFPLAAVVAGAAECGAATQVGPGEFAISDTGAAT